MLEAVSSPPLLVAGRVSNFSARLGFTAVKVCCCCVPTAYSALGRRPSGVPAALVQISYLNNKGNNVESVSEKAARVLEVAVVGQRLLLVVSRVAWGAEGARD